MPSKIAGSAAKKPEELNAEFIRIAADLGDGIAEAIDSSVAAERAAIGAWLRAFGRETTVSAAFDILALAVENGDYPRDLPTPHGCATDSTAIAERVHPDTRRRPRGRLGAGP